MSVLNDNALRLAETFWHGGIDHKDNPLFHTEPTSLTRLAPLLTSTATQAEPSDGVYLMLGFANTAVIKSGKSLLVIDVGAAQFGEQIRDVLQAAFPQCSVFGIVYTHGHMDHVGGAAAFLAKDASLRDLNDATRPEIYAHASLPRRFERYKATSGYNSAINAKQFQIPADVIEPLYELLVLPTTVIDDKGGRVRLPSTGEEVIVYHAKGETDDALWLWVPRHRALITGDLFINCCPNCGNPQKVQRYPKEWSQALHAMKAIRPTLLVPGHGPPILGEERVRQALEDTFQFLDDIIHQTLVLINKNVPLHEILETVVIRRSLLEKPYLKPYYDDPVFIIRNLHRLYAGWYSGFLPDLRPARPADVGAMLLHCTDAPLSLVLEKVSKALAVSQAQDQAQQQRVLKSTLTICELLNEAITKKTVSADGSEISQLNVLRSNIIRQLRDVDQSLMGRGIYAAAVNDCSPPSKL